MISTVTATVVSIVVTTSSTGLSASLVLAAVLTLISSLIMKELATGEGLRLSSWGRNLDTIILPLLFVFFFTVFMRVWEILS